MPHKQLLWVCSLQYSPIYKSHCCALGKQAEKQGLQVKYLFSRAYEWMLPPEILENTVFIGKSTDIISAVTDSFDFRLLSYIRGLFEKDAPDYIYFYNFHPFLNYVFAKFSKTHGTTFIQHVQEPFVENKSIYRGLQQYWLIGFEYLQARVMKKTDIAVVSSDRSRSLFCKRYPDYRGRLLTIPLMYEDFGDLLQNLPDRKFITFIGPPVPAKGTKIFLSIVKYSCENQYPFEFLLISRKKVSDQVYYQYPNLHVFYQENISDKEMAYHLHQSRMVLTPYLVATQSSVILTSLMYGTPALSSDVGGLPEFVLHKETGYLVDTAALIEEWIIGIKYILENNLQMSESCRDHFFRNFAETNWPKYFPLLFDK